MIVLIIAHNVYYISHIHIPYIYILIWEATGDETSQPRFVLLTLPTSLAVRWLLNWRCPFLAGTLEEVEMGRQHPVVNRESKHEQNLWDH